MYLFWQIATLSAIVLSILLTLLNIPQASMLCVIWAVFFKVGAIESLLTKR